MPLLCLGLNSDTATRGNEDTILRKGVLVTKPTEIISKSSEVMKTILMSQLEHELMDIRLEMRRLEGVINSPLVKSQKAKSESKKKLEKLIKNKNKLADKITEVMLLGADYDE